MRHLGNALIIFGIFFVLGTAGKSDTTFMPISQILIQVGIAIVSILVGYMLRRTKKANK